MHVINEEMVDEYELYPLEQDTSNILVVYRGQSVFKPLYLNVRELGDEGVPVRASKSKHSDVEEVLYSESTGFYDEPELVCSDKEDRRVEIQEERINELENDVEKISSVQEMQRWVLLFGGVIVGLILMYALAALQPHLLVI